MNVGVPSLTIAKVGSGTVSSTDKVLSCGSKCTSTYALGTVVTLTASPGGNAFTGWGGACSGTGLSCTVTVNETLTAVATFAPQFTLSVGRSNPGTVTATPAGNDRTLSCGGTCSAKFTQGTAVTLTATPPAGKSFVGWSGACSGTAPTCTVSIGKNTSVQASFGK